MMRQFELVERIRAYDPDVDEDRINAAYIFSYQRHGTQLRASGDPYFSHPIEVAGLMTDLKLDQDAVITALLHDTVEDTETTLEEIEGLFGPKVAALVDGVTKLSTINAGSRDEHDAENLRKFFLAMSDDLRVLLVKLADRLHNMRTLQYIKKPEKRRRIARETMDIYAPLAHRIGMYHYMSEMQLIAFKELEPEAHNIISERLALARDRDKSSLSDICREIETILAENNIAATVQGREKHPYSIWQKMQQRALNFEHISDIVAFRIITDTPAECYAALGVLHQKWPMVPERFKDYISTPRSNGYKSLHSTILLGKNMRVEVQIRTQEMHEVNEYGVAAHWAYKQKGGKADNQANWIRDLIETIENSKDPREFLEHTRMAMYPDQIFIFTPKGRVYPLPIGSTSIDLAYAVHTDLGGMAVGTLINGRNLPLHTVLKTGDIVEILKSEGQEPQAEWLHFTATAKARAAIRRYVRVKQRDEHMEMGRQMLDILKARLPSKVSDKAVKAAAKRLNLSGEDALYMAVAQKDLGDLEVLDALMPGVLKSDPDIKDWHHPLEKPAVSIEGLRPGMAYDLSSCCHPIPGDNIVGLRKEGQNVRVHTIDCMALVDGDNADWIRLSWGADSDGATARLNIILYNKPGTLAELTGVFALYNANIIKLVQSNRDSDFHSFRVDFDVHNIYHLNQILSALRANDAVAQAERVADVEHFSLEEIKP